MGEMYHITMLVSGEQEDAIRSLFWDKQWTCCIQALSNKHLAVLKQAGYTELFSLTEISESPETCDNLFTEIKTEITADDDSDNEFSDNQSSDIPDNTSHFINNVDGDEGQNLDKSEIEGPSLDKSEIDNTSRFANDGVDIETPIKSENTSNYTNDSSEKQSLNARKNKSSNVVDENDDTMDYDIANNTQKDDVKEINKIENTHNNDIVHTKQKCDGNKIVEPNPASAYTMIPHKKQNKIITPQPDFLMINPTANSQLVGSTGQPVGNIIQSVGNIQAAGGMTQPIGNVKQHLKSMIHQGGKINQRIDHDIIPPKRSKSQKVRSKNRGLRSKGQGVESKGLTKIKTYSDTDSDTGPKCSVCGKRFISAAIMKKHFKQVHVGFLAYGCDDCPERFKTKDELNDHMRDVHEQSEETIANNNNEKELTHEELIAMGRLQCQICYKYYRNMRNLRQHLHRMHVGALTWTCGVCSDVFLYRDDYWKHIRETNHNTSITNLGNYLCDSCGRIYKKYDKFFEHKKICLTDGRTQEELKTIPCEVCGSKFKTDSQLYSHKLSVHKVEPVTCEICGVLKKNRKALIAHKIRHDQNRKKYSCDECGKAFFSPSLLKAHTRTHTKEKPFKCPLCDYRSALKPNIQKHGLNVHKTRVEVINVDELS